MIDKCEHEIGRKAIGGFPGHEHIHATGEQICLRCGKTLKELLAEQKPDWEWCGRFMDDGLADIAYLNLRKAVRESIGKKVHYKTG